MVGSLDSLKCKREKLEVEVSELKDAIRLAVLDDPEKWAIISENTTKLNEVSKELLKQEDEERLRQQDISDEQRKLEAIKIEQLEAEHEAKSVETKRSLELVVQQSVEMKGKLECELADATRTVAEQRRQLLDNIKLCFKVSLVQINNIDHLRILHFQIPLDGNYNSNTDDTTFFKLIWLRNGAG